MTQLTTSIQSVVDLILERCPGGNPNRTLDTFESGDPSVPVRGIVVTFMATCQVLEKAVELGANLVITHEATFYNGHDEIAWLQDDCVYESKKKFIEDHGLVIWRFHDGPHRQIPDGIVKGMALKLGWECDPIRKSVFEIEPVTVRDLAQLCKECLNVQVVRVAGDLDTVCSRISLKVGSCGGHPQIEMYQKSDVDVVICGESPEWETCEYVRDANTFGKKKALIVMGHANSEEAGMEWIAEWMRTFLPQPIPVLHVPAGDPFQYV